MTPDALFAALKKALGDGPRPPLPDVPAYLRPAVALVPSTSAPDALVAAFVAAARNAGAEVVDEAPALDPDPAGVAPFDASHAVRRARAGIAASGSVLVDDGADLAMMAAPILVVRLDPRTIVATLHDALATAPTSFATRVIVTGPSKTADIEGILITGVHGPGRVVIVLDAAPASPPGRRGGV